MRAIVPAIILVLSALPLAAAGPIGGTDCDDKEPAVVTAEGCSAFTFDPDSGAYAMCGVVQHHQTDIDFRSVACWTGGPAGFAGAWCAESSARHARDPYAEDARRSCGVGAGDATGTGVFVTCSETSYSSGQRNVTWFECYPMGWSLETSGEGALRNVTIRAADLDGDREPDLVVSCGTELPEPRWPFETSGRCSAGPRAVVLNAGYSCERQLPSPGAASSGPCRGDAGASGRNGSYPFDPDIRDFRCAILAGADAEISCTGSDGDGDGEPEASASCTLRNMTHMEPTKLEIPNLRCAGGSNNTYAMYGVMKAMRVSASPSCALSSTATDEDIGCGDEISVEGEDGSPAAACRFEGNVTKKQKQWLPANFRCAAGGDADGDGAPDTVAECSSDGIAIDHEGVQRCKWYASDMDSDGDLAVARNGTFTATATLSDGTSQDLRCAPPADPAAGPAAPSCTTATKWKVYSPLPNARASGSCDGGTSGAWASCVWEGPAGWGSAYHQGAPPTHSNVLAADLDRDGALDVFVVEGGGAVSAYGNADGCSVFLSAKPPSRPFARSCLA